MRFKEIYKSKKEKEIEQQVSEFRLYLENNYKDLAIQAKKDVDSLVEDYYREGKIKDKTYMKYKELLAVYTKQMEHYNHQQFYQS